ncbi:filamentous hemagglutinin N-terminal domain-containing protein [Desulfonema magnum]|uniref:Filamentous hemagglutinin family N-terminal domain-containing protein n=1 Tax=Desulfonema magnum TaxID=45655 RepID=A0A975GRY8_9BACT|nr:filamentous hemagglutinin N-terminal domain-containing protein [Desulfonema magnum]QTA91440.1 Filamentous hemagglutinin family N-terminal domain-containing protein [Desulfonema magnum]
MKKNMQFIISVLVVITACFPAYADGTHPRGIRSDGSLGTAGKLSLPGPDYEIKAEYGQQAGANLFHSFQQFNIHSDESATFTGPDSVKNIISRVTGGEASWIDGRLASAIPGADLFFLNPAGLMFGPNASLDLGGSFHISTADYLRMGDNEQFYVNPPESDVLSTAMPAAFGFLDGNIATISFKGKGEISKQDTDESPPGLRVSENKTISVIAGSIEMDNGTFFKAQKMDENGNPVFQDAVDENGNMIYGEDGLPVLAVDENGNPIPVMENVPAGGIQAPGGRINLIGVGTDGESELGNQEPDTEDFENKGDIRLADHSLIEVGGENAGTIYIRSGNFIADNSRIQSVSRGSKPSENSVIDIQGKNISLNKGGAILSSTSGTGKSSDINIHVSESVCLSGVSSDDESAFIKTETRLKDEDAGDAGDILIDTPTLSVANGANISSSSYGAGDGGNVVFHADEKIYIHGTDTDGEGCYVQTGSSDIFSESTGKSGDIVFETKNLFVNDGASVSTTSSEKSGDITIRASESVHLTGHNQQKNGNHILSVSFNNDAGDILIETGNFYRDDGGIISSTSFGDDGKSGDIILRASDSVYLSGVRGAGLGSEIYGMSIGSQQAGEIIIETNVLSLNDGAVLINHSSGISDGGDIMIRASESASLSGINSLESYGKGIGRKGSGIANSAIGEDAESGNGGNIIIETPKLSVRDGGWIESSSRGGGNAGNITIQAESVSISGTDEAEGYVSRISTSALSEEEYAGNGGNISIASENLILESGGQIAADTKGYGSGGSIAIHASETLACGGVNPHGENEEGYGSGIYTRSTADHESAGTSGSVQIECKTLSLTDGGLITNSLSGGGTSGDITVSAAESVNISGDSSEISSHMPLQSQTKYQSAASYIRDTQASGIYSRSESQKSFAGRAGNINISADELNLSDSGQVSAESMGMGKAGNITINTSQFSLKSDASVSSGSGFINAYEFADISERDDRFLVPGDVITVADVGNGKTGVYLHTGENLMRFNTTYTVENLTELNQLDQHYDLRNGDIAEVENSHDGMPERFIFSSDQELDSDLKSWIKLESEISAELADMTALNEIETLYVEDYGMIPPYTSGTLLHVDDAGDGKPADFVYTLLPYDIPNMPPMVIGNAVKLNNFKVEDITQLHQISHQYAISDGALATVADNGTKSRFVFRQGEWIAFNHAHEVADKTAIGTLIPAQIGHITKINDSEAGKGQTFIYAGSDWSELKHIHIVPNMTELNALSAHSGDAATVSDAGQGRSEAFLYSGGEWIKLVSGYTGGTITVNADTVCMENHSQISTSTAGNGTAGHIHIFAEDIELNSGASLSSNSESVAFGGEAGTLNVHAERAIRISNGASLTTQAKDAGGGSMNIQAKNIIYLNNGKITTSVQGGDGKGGDIEMTKPDVAILNHSRIEANAFEGAGGNIHIVSEQFVSSSDSAVEASSEKGIDGNINIESPDTDVGTGLTIMPGNYLDAEKWAKTPCSKRSVENMSRFVIRHKDAAPGSPDDWQPLLPRPDNSPSPEKNR